MSANDSSAKKGPSGFAKFITALVMFLIILIINAFVIGVAIVEALNLKMKTPVALTLGIVLSLAYALIIYIIPYLRRIKSVNWFAYCALGDAAWWAYLLFTN